MYEGKEFAELNKLKGRYWYKDMMRTDLRGKVFSLLPFFAEAAFTDKNFVLRMQLYPQA